MTLSQLQGDVQGCEPCLPQQRETLGSIKHIEMLDSDFERARDTLSWEDLKTHQIRAQELELSRQWRAWLGMCVVHYLLCVRFW